LQLRSVLNDIDVAAIKTGMLANADVVRATARMLKALPSLPPLVIDPVCVSTSGHTLLEGDALGTLITELLPLATVLTPNTSEAALLLQIRHQVLSSVGNADPGTPTPLPMTSIQDMVGTARALCALGPQAVLLKGGHVTRGAIRLSDVEAAANAATALGNLRVDKVEYDGLVQRGANMEVLIRAAAASHEPTIMGRNEDEDAPVVVDVLCEMVDRGGGSGGERGGTRCTLFVRPYLDSMSTHGTGCTLGAALACALARGLSRTFFTSRLSALSLDAFRYVHSR
jgi:hydroxymethylpyrimidine/phosphomethylpyrimidine kinase